MSGRAKLRARLALALAVLMIGCEESLVEPFGVAEGGIVYGWVTDAASGRPASHVPVAMRSAELVFQGNDSTTANPPGTVTVGVQPALVLRFWASDWTDQSGRFEMLARAAEGVAGTWELGCGPYHDPALMEDVLAVRDSVFLEPYAVVRRDIQC